MEKEVSKGHLTRRRSGILNTPERVLRSRGEKLDSPIVDVGSPKPERSSKRTLKNNSDSTTETPKRRSIRASSAQPEDSPVTKRISSARRRSTSLQPETSKKSEEVNASKSKLSSTPSDKSAVASLRGRRSKANPSSPSSESSNVPSPEPVKEIRRITRSSIRNSPIKEIPNKLTGVTTRKSSILEGSDSSPVGSPDYESASDKTPSHIPRRRTMLNLGLSPVEEIKDETTVNILKKDIKEESLTTPTISRNTTESSTSTESKTKLNIVAPGQVDEEIICPTKVHNDNSITTSTKSEPVFLNESVSDSKNESFNESEDSGIKEMEEINTVEDKNVKALNINDSSRVEAIAEVFEDQNNDPNSKALVLTTDNNEKSSDVTKPSKLLVETNKLKNIENVSNLETPNKNAINCKNPVVNLVRLSPKLISEIDFNNTSVSSKSLEVEIKTPSTSSADKTNKNNLAESIAYKNTIEKQVPSTPVLIKTSKDKMSMNESITDQLLSEIIEEEDATKAMSPGKSSQSSSGKVTGLNEDCNFKLRIETDCIGEGDASDLKLDGKLRNLDSGSKTMKKGLELASCDRKSDYLETGKPDETVNSSAEKDNSKDFTNPRIDDSVNESQVDSSCSLLVNVSDESIIRNMDQPSIKDPSEEVDLVKETFDGKEEYSISAEYSPISNESFKIEENETIVQDPLIKETDDKEGVTEQYGKLPNSLSSESADIQNETQTDDKTLSESDGLNEESGNSTQQSQVDSDRIPDIHIQKDSKSIDVKTVLNTDNISFLSSKEILEDKTEENIEKIEPANAEIKHSISHIEVPGFSNAIISVKKPESAKMGKSKCLPEMTDGLNEVQMKSENIETSNNIETTAETSRIPNKVISDKETENAEISGTTNKLLFAMESENADMEDSNSSPEISGNSNEKVIIKESENDGKKESNCSEISGISNGKMTENKFESDKDNSNCSPEMSRISNENVIDKEPVDRRSEDSNCSPRMYGATYEKVIDKQSEDNEKKDSIYSDKIYDALSENVIDKEPVNFDLSNEKVIDKKSENDEKEDSKFSLETSVSSKTIIDKEPVNADLSYVKVIDKKSENDKKEDSKFSLETSVSSETIIDKEPVNADLSNEKVIDKKFENEDSKSSLETSVSSKNIIDKEPVNSDNSNENMFMCGKSYTAHISEPSSFSEIASTHGIPMVEKETKNIVMEKCSQKRDTSSGTSSNISEGINFSNCNKSESSANETVDDEIPTSTDLKESALQAESSVSPNKTVVYKKFQSTDFDNDSKANKVEIYNESGFNSQIVNQVIGKHSNQMKISNVCNEFIVDSKLDVSQESVVLVGNETIEDSIKGDSEIINDGVGTLEVSSGKEIINDNILTLTDESNDQNSKESCNKVRDKITETQRLASAEVETKSQNHKPDNGITNIELIQTQESTVEDSDTKVTRTSVLHTGDNDAKATQTHKRAVEDVDVDIIQTQEPTIEDADTEVIKTQEPTIVDVDAGAIQTQQPSIKVPDSKVIQTPEPTIEDSDTEVIQSQEPTIKDCDTEVIQTQEPTIVDVDAEAIRTQQPSIKVPDSKVIQTHEPTMENADPEVIQIQGPAAENVDAMTIEIKEPAIKEADTEVIESQLASSCPLENDVQDEKTGCHFDSILLDTKVATSSKKREEDLCMSSNASINVVVENSALPSIRLEPNEIPNERNNEVSLSDESGKEIVVSDESDIEMFVSDETKANLGNNIICLGVVKDTSNVNTSQKGAFVDYSSSTSQDSDLTPDLSDESKMKIELCGTSHNRISSNSSFCEAETTSKTNLLESEKLEECQIVDSSDEGKDVEYENSSIEDDVPFTGRDFLDDEADEGEETKESSEESVDEAADIVHIKQEKIIHPAKKVIKKEKRQFSIIDENSVIPRSFRKTSNQIQKKMKTSWNVKHNNETLEKDQFNNFPISSNMKFEVVTSKKQNKIFQDKKINKTEKSKKGIFNDPQTSKLKISSEMQSSRSSVTGCGIKFNVLPLTDYYLKRCISNILRCSSVAAGVFKVQTQADYLKSNRGRNHDKLSLSSVTGYGIKFEVLPLRDSYLKRKLNTQNCSKAAGVFKTQTEADYLKYNRDRHNYKFCCNGKFLVRHVQYDNNYLINKPSSVSSPCLVSSTQPASNSEMFGTLKRCRIDKLEREIKTIKSKPSSSDHIIPSLKTTKEFKNLDISSQKKKRKLDKLSPSSAEPASDSNLEDVKTTGKNKNKKSKPTSDKQPASSNVTSFSGLIKEDEFAPSSNIQKAKTTSKVNKIKSTISTELNKKVQPISLSKTSFCGVSLKSVCIHAEGEGKPSSKKIKPQKTSYIASLHNLSTGVNAFDLIVLFTENKVKGIESIDLEVCQPRLFCQNRGYGFIEFSDEEALQTCVDLSRTMKLNGKDLWMRACSCYSPQTSQSKKWLSESIFQLSEKKLQCEKRLINLVSP